jgi:hypothetical protein
MLLAALYAESYHNVMDREPGTLDRVMGAWRDLVDWFTSNVIVKVTNSYWAIAHADLVAALALLLILALIVIAVLLLRRRSSVSVGKPMSAKDFIKSARQAAKSGNYVRAGEHY